MPAPAKKIVATVENFMTDVVEASNTIPVLVDFWAPWCGPCRTLMPLLDRIADDYEGRFILAKVNTEEQPQLATHFQIRSIPTVLLIHHGEVADQFVGLQPEAAIKTLLDRHVSPVADLAESRQSRSARGPRTGRRTSPRDCWTGATPRVRRWQSRRWLPLSPTTRNSQHSRRGSPSSRSPMPNRTSWLCGRRWTANPSDAAARHALAAHHALAGDYGTALAEWLELMRRDRAFGDDAGRRSLRQAFEVLGEQDPLVTHYRRRMASLLH